MAINNNTSALLALPVELVGRIADSLEPESLLMLRLTCKVLEHSTYDLFAKTFFERRFSCIYYEPRWLLLNKVIHSRLSNRVREVTFTTDPLEATWYKNLQLAPNKSEADMITAQSFAGGALSLSVGPQTQVPTWPSTAVFHRVFCDFKRLAIRALIKVDFLEAWGPPTDPTAHLVKADVLIAAVSAGVAIDTLKLDVYDAHALENVLVHLETELTTSTRTLKCFQFRTNIDGHDPKLATTILESANDLCELVVMPNPGCSMTTAVLQVNDFSLLTTLRISGASFPGEELVTGLSVCRSLPHLHLSNLGLISGEEAWPSVFRTLASMPQLHKLCLAALWDTVFRFRRLTFCDLVHGRTTQDGCMVGNMGREKTAAGLNELIAKPLPREDDDHTYTFNFNKGRGCFVCVYGTE
ncbi:hypothetical protein Q7P35_010975 [Cladosporium inversicolor]